MRTVRRICAIALLTAAFSTFALGEEGWIGTGLKPPQPTAVLVTSQATPELDIAGTGEESSYFDELYEATLLFLQMNLL
ncbi:MAG: hypothetical protein QOE47_2717 [Pyrinomonadaceae bacterium]|jgi:hypothetical protein|nr:hypothetical protein [Pyrinomonadaceae bacterium]MDX6271166.1 hypothetical protein [Acidobacteriota bacterium]